MFPRSVESYLKELCELDPSVNDYIAVQRLGSYFTQGFSIKSLEYWMQIYSQHRFAKFDRGQSKNVQLYGSNEPPIVDISSIRDVPIALMVGEYDKLVPIHDSRWIRDNLDTNALKFYKEYKYGHLSFLAAKNIWYLNDVQKLLNEYSQ